MRRKVEIIYACLALLGGILGLLLAADKFFLQSKSPASSVGLAFSGLISVATGIAILKKDRKAVSLVWAMTVIAGIAMLARGIPPIDIFFMAVQLGFALWFTKARRSPAEVNPTATVPVAHNEPTSELTTRTDAQAQVRPERQEVKLRLSQVIAICVAVMGLTIFVCIAFIRFGQIGNSKEEHLLQPAARNVNEAPAPEPYTIIYDRDWSSRFAEASCNRMDTEESNGDVFDEPAQMKESERELCIRNARREEDEFLGKVLAIFQSDEACSGVRLLVFDGTRSSDVAFGEIEKLHKEQQAWVHVNFTPSSKEQSWMLIFKPESRPSPMGKNDAPRLAHGVCLIAKNRGGSVQ